MPDQFRAAAQLQHRCVAGDRIYLNYLQNGRGATAVGNFSPRARPDFQVAVRVEWTDLESGLRLDSFTVAKVSEARRAKY
jgi:DNA primase